MKVKLGCSAVLTTVYTHQYVHVCFAVEEVMMS